MIMRKILAVSLFVLLVALSCAVLWRPVVTVLLTFHDWTGFPDAAFELLWGTVTVALSTSLVAALFRLIGWRIRRSRQQH